MPTFECPECGETISGDREEVVDEALRHFDTEHIDEVISRARIRDTLTA